MSRDYTGPLANLLTCGMPKNAFRADAWLDYRKFGLGEEHVPDLIRMAADMEMNAANNDSDDIWAPLHAWRALGQLRAEAAAEPLVRLLTQLPDDDWLSSDLPTIFAMIGPAAVPPLVACLRDGEVDGAARLVVPECLARIGLEHPAAREDCVAALVRQLEAFEGGDPALNGFLVASLIDLGATNAIALIREVFAKDCIDPRIVGDVEDVEIALGLRTKRSAPRQRIDILAGLPLLPEDGPTRAQPLRRAQKVGRNAPCPCGSGRKFKKCCLGKTEDVAMPALDAWQ